MNHWDRFQRIYIGVLIFISIWTAAAVVVFGAMPAADLNALSGRALLMGHVKCWALASANLLTYLQGTKKAPTLP